MRLFGFEIRRIPATEPAFARQRDLWMICTVCGRLSRLNRLEDGRTILAALWGVEKIRRLELGCPCGKKIVIFSSEEVFEKAQPEVWEKLTDGMGRR